eukprot:4412453-Prymnesium_polylepis.1
MGHCVRGAELVRRLHAIQNRPRRQLCRSRSSGRSLAALLLGIPHQHSLRGRQPAVQQLARELHARSRGRALQKAYRKAKTSSAFQELAKQAAAKEQQKAEAASPAPPKGKNGAGQTGPSFPMPKLPQNLKLPSPPKLPQQIRLPGAKLPKVTMPKNVPAIRLPRYRSYRVTAEVPQP